MRKEAILVLALAFAGHASAATYTLNNIFATIPDGDFNGYQSSLTVSGFSGNLADVNVTLNISGGFNGDLYGYLHYNGVNAILLNRVGRSSTSSVGYPDAGFGPDGSANSFTFDDQAAHDIHAYRTFSFALNGNGQLTGNWQPDARNIDPTSSGSTFDSASRSNPLGIFNGMDGNGTWTLYLSDVSPGGESTLVSWGIQLTPIPEPGIGALVLLATGLGTFCSRFRQKLLL